MNQTGYYIEYVKCVKCKKNQVKIRKYYDKRLSNWTSTDYPICIECLNSLYGFSCYADTDSVIYKDFNKKQEV